MKLLFCLVSLFFLSHVAMAQSCDEARELGLVSNVSRLDLKLRGLDGKLYDVGFRIKCLEDEEGAKDSADVENVPFLKTFGPDAKTTVHISTLGDEITGEVAAELALEIVEPRAEGLPYVHTYIFLWSERPRSNERFGESFLYFKFFYRRYVRQDDGSMEPAPFPAYARSQILERRRSFATHALGKLPLRTNTLTEQGREATFAKRYAKRFAKRVSRQGAPTVECDIRETTPVTFAGSCSGRADTHDFRCDFLFEHVSGVSEVLRAQCKANSNALN